jgi:DNA-binding response OmpR family regulator
VNRPLNIQDEKRDFRNQEILLFEREQYLRKAIFLCLQELGINVIEAVDIDQARRVIEIKKPDIFILDLGFPIGEESSLIETFRAECGDNKPVIVTTIDRPADLWRKKYLPDTILYKPFDVRYLVKRVRMIL